MQRDGIEDVRRLFWGSCRGLSVAGEEGVGALGPGVDAAGDGLGAFEALLAEPVGDAEGAGAVVAEDEEAVVGVEFLVGAGGNLAHGDEGAALDVDGFPFPEFADVDDFGFAFVEQGFGVGGGDFVIVHVV